MKKQVDKDTVLHTAIILMTANDSTTSLDVKNHLRGLNFWAVQDEISRLMNELSDERSWVRTSNGRFNTYQLTQPVAAVSTTTAPQIAAAILHSDIVDAIGDAIEDASGFDIEDDMSHDLQDDAQLSLSDVMEVLDVLAIRFQFDVSGLPLGSLIYVSDIYDLIVQRTGRPGGSAQRSRPTVQPGNSLLQVPPVVKSPKTRVNLKPVAVLQSGIDNTTSNIQNNFPANHWVLYMSNGQGRTIYDGAETRDHVRSAYTRLMGDKIQKTRACRVKNLHRLGI
jgi:hypothetical protein